jgi:hypothetical protein
VALLIGLGFTVGAIFFARWVGRSRTVISTRSDGKEL